MHLIINGKEMQTPDSISVTELLTHLQLENKMAIVEINQSIINKSSYEVTKLADGDRIEIVHFVGGG
ncbi:sulfur carrier protein ThiS [Cytobacillus horneckiae]|uniref:sulfur carrier protein ThiS n=1 Tax=Cytobacillus horneckiae TaxID=549687 RepID=UPI003D9A0CFC